MYIDWDEIICRSLLLVIILGLVGSIAGVVWIFSPQKARRDAEWQQKVDNCVLNENFRKDCKLILYKDMQNHSQRYYSGTYIVPVFTH